MSIQSYNEKNSKIIYPNLWSTQTKTKLFWLHCRFNFYFSDLLILSVEQFIYFLKKIKKK